MLTALVVLLYFFIVVLDFLPVIKNGKKKETIVYFSLLTVSFVVLILYTFDIKLPPTASFIEAAIKSVFNIK